METGRQVFGRFKITGPLPDVGDLERHAAVEVETGREVELVRPGALAALRPGARDRFREAWSGPEASSPPPARLGALVVGELDGRPAAIRPRMHTEWSANLRLTPDQARELAGWVLPALMVAPPPGGTFTPQDLMLDPTGRPWIAPSGTVPKPSVTAPPLFTPPDPTDADIDQARYGFGVLLYRALSGSWPFEPTGDQAKLRERQRTPAPIRQVAPDIPAQVAQLVDQLVHPDAAIRSRAAMPPPLSPPVLPLPERAPRPPATTAPAVRPPARTGARRDVPMDAFAIVLDNARATESSRRRLAALLDLPADAFHLPSGAPAEVLVDSANTPEAAAARLDALMAARAPLSIVGTDPPQQARMLMAGGGAALVLLAPLFGFLTGPVGAGLVAILALAALGMGWQQLSQATSRLDTLRRTGQYVERGPRAAPALADGARELGVARKAQAARKAILVGDLPDTVRIDLLQSVDDLEGIGTDAQADVLGALQDIIQTAEGWSDRAEAPEDALSRARRAVAAARGVQR
jgi:hypothetical protein